MALLLATKFGFKFHEELGHGDGVGVTLEGGELKGSKHVEGRRESLEDEENPDCFKGFLVKLGATDFNHKVEGLAE